MDENTFLQQTVTYDKIWCITSFQIQSSPVWNGATQDPYYPNNLKHSYQLAIS
jgi:hypothetical protein